MNYYELRFTYESPIETTVISDVLASELGEIGFESFTENEDGLQAYISDQLYNVKEDIGQQVNLAEKEPKRLRQMMMTFERLKRETGKITNF